MGSRYKEGGASADSPSGPSLGCWMDCLEFSEAQEVRDPVVLLLQAVCGMVPVSI